MRTFILILITIILLFIIFKFIKPYTIKYDHTIMLNGGIGSGKTLTCVKLAVNLLRRARLSHWWQYKVQAKIINKFRHWKNKKIVAYNYKHSKIDNKTKKILPYIDIPPMPQIYSNLPINFKPHFWSKEKNRQYSVKLTMQHLTLTQEMAQNSIVLIDELPQLVNQFNWDEEIVKHNMNEFITFFRHYYNGYLLITSQAVDDVVVQIRRKLNQAIWCRNFKRHLFGLFYSIEMCDMLLNDQITSTSSTFVDDNVKRYYGLFPPKNTYDTRCYSERLNNIYKKLVGKQERFKKLKTNDIMRIEKYNSPLDDETNNITKKTIHDKYLRKEQK